METVISRDGTVIAFERSGEGPPVVLVHGTTADHSRWKPVLPQFEAHFTVLAMDRRGRGASGDGDSYSVEAEFEDVAAVASAAGPGVSVVGHSYGALCAMEAALRVPGLRRLVLYEPAFHVPGLQMYDPDARRRLEALAEGDDRELVLTTFLREIAQMSEQDIEAMRREEASWQARLAAAHTAVRELADADYVLDAGRFEKLMVPTLLLMGERSPEILRRPTQQLASVLPQCRLTVLPGQGHAAISTAPDLFLDEVIGFLTNED